LLVVAVGVNTAVLVLQVDFVQLLLQQVAVVL
jgi:hypothetical protein